MNHQDQIVLFIPSRESPPDLRCTPRNDYNAGNGIHFQFIGSEIRHLRPLPFYFYIIERGLQLFNFHIYPCMGQTRKKAFVNKCLQEAKSPIFRSMGVRKASLIYSNMRFIRRDRIAKYIDIISNILV